MITDKNLEEELPCTSYPCQWIQPKTRKESTIPISQVKFEKHTYGKKNKKEIFLKEDFDPRPAKYRKTAKENIPQLLNDIHAQNAHTCISILLDPRYKSEPESECLQSVSTSSPRLPEINELHTTITAFKESLKTSPEQVRQIERNTQLQSQSKLWFSVRQYRITASLFGEIFHRRSDTPPDNLVLKILQQKQFSSPAVQWGKENESAACREYVTFQHMNGHPDLVFTQSGFFISEEYPFLGATPDGLIYDPSSSQPFGFLEIKCPFSHRNVTPTAACDTSKFYCTLSGDGQQISLKRNHRYYAQVQGQMAIGGRPWCDFVVYTTMGIGVERIPFDQSYWDTLLQKLISFYDCCVAPELVSPLHVLGLPMRDLSKTT